MIELEYHKPDPRWELWFAQTFEEHLQHNVITNYCLLLRNKVLF